MKLIGRIERHLPEPIKDRIYNLCKNYVDYYNNDNNCNMKTNGELNFLKNNLENCKIVFDVGANIGEWSELVLKMNNKVSLHCFELSEYTFRKLKDNNFGDNVICNNFGLGSKKENRILYIFDDGDGCNSLYKRKGLEYLGLETPKRKEEVQIDTIDDYCYENQIQQIDLIKVDVEGHKLEVFKGASRMLKEERVKIIQFEYGGCNIDARVLLKDIFEYFEGMSNYRFYKIFPKTIKRIDRYAQRLEMFQYSNYLIILNGVSYY